MASESQHAFRAVPGAQLRNALRDRMPTKPGTMSSYMTILVLHRFYTSTAQVLHRHCTGIALCSGKGGMVPGTTLVPLSVLDWHGTATAPVLYWR